MPGNHDYYAARLDNESPLRDLVHGSGSWFVQKTELRHRRDRYFCATLWTDFDLLGDREAAKQVAPRFMRDYDMISIEAPGYEMLDPDEVLPRRIVPITPEDTITLHREHRGWLEERLSTPHFAGEGRTFVVTHHGPHSSTSGRLDRLTPAFHSELNEVLERSDIDIWFFGHSHRRLSSMVAGTRIQNVSIGYLDETHGDDEDDLAEVCFVPPAPPPTPAPQDANERTARLREVERDMAYALTCRETAARVKNIDLSQETRLLLQDRLAGATPPSMSEDNYHDPEEVIAVLARELDERRQ